MADAGETSTAAANRVATYSGERGGGGGKLRRAKKPPATPYDRPSRRRWISTIVEPAKRLFSGLPSIFSSNLDIVDEVDAEEEHEVGVAEENCSLDPVFHESTEGFAPSEDKGKSKLVISDEGGLDKGQGSSGGVPDVEQLINEKTFSREEIDHLIKILHARVVDVEQDRNTPSMTGPDEVERAEISNRRLKTSLDEEEGLHMFQLATPKSPPRPAMQDGIGASPVDIAKAYMSSRASESVFTSTLSAQKTEKLGVTSDYISNSVMQSPLRKAPICWPGAITQDQQDYSTPPSRFNRSGQHSFPRTPYSRTIFSKSKSRLSPLRDNERFPSISPAPFRPTPTSAYEKVQSVNNVAESNYGIGGPIRRTRDKLTLGTPTRNSPLFTTGRTSRLSRESNADVSAKKTFELGSSSNTNIDLANSKVESPEARVRSVHPHSNRLAWKILEQLDRPVTLKEQSKELSLAVSKQDASVQNNSSPSTVGVGVGTSKKLDGVELGGKTNGENIVLRREISNGNGAEKDVVGSMKSLDKTSSVSGIDNGPSSSLERLDSQRSSEQGIFSNAPKTSLLFGDPRKGATTATINNAPRSESPNSQRKPKLPSIAVEKSGFRTSFYSITSPSFSFPVTTSSTSLADPPTPSVTPSLFTTPPQPKSSANVPTSNSGNKITIAPPVVAFPSRTTLKPNETSPPKFKFDSDKPRLSFAVPEDNDNSAPNDAAIPKFTFGSGESRLNFGITGSDALCCK